MKLTIVPTPIGNLEDITLRALRILKEVDIIFCEDTRTTKNLLKHYDIDKKCYAYHINNEHKQVEQYVRWLQNGQTAALVSDAGTPGISDPGYLFIRECLTAGVEIECLPGATAFIPALVTSGFPCDKFYFHGFLPHKKGKETALKMLSERNETVVFYESPHRLVKTLTMMQTIFAQETKICVSREISKVFEEHYRGSIQDAINHFSAKEVKGEIVVTVANRI
ncbi:MAG: 16S rRNA (cytidine(1402)-2'-O)-methyltransferase [Bacteroidetes bacterium]|nr:16S rRNA (cytidine(1402)-2'-O)-methyltransferase [Bacteroidota bacterium]MCL1968066.1 16S rRNA (cytidine(1402)-2'-O)-methyltransferase [Bacteroidota bacterium]